MAGADMCNDHSVSRLAFCGKGDIAKLQDPFWALSFLFVYMFKPVPTPRTGLAECYSCRREGTGQLAW